MGTRRWPHEALQSPGSNLMEAHADYDATSQPFSHALGVHGRALPTKSRMHPTPQHWGMMPPMIPSAPRSQPSAAAAWWRPEGTDLLQPQQQMQNAAQHAYPTSFAGSASFAGSGAYPMSHYSNGGTSSAQQMQIQACSSGASNGSQSLPGNMNFSSRSNEPLNHCNEPLNIETMQKNHEEQMAQALEPAKRRRVHT